MRENHFNPQLFLTKKLLEQKKIGRKNIFIKPFETTQSPRKKGSPVQRKLKCMSMCEWMEIAHFYVEQQEQEFDVKKNQQTFFQKHNKIRTIFVSLQHKKKYYTTIKNL